MKHFIFVILAIIASCTTVSAQSYVWKQVNSGDMKFVGSLLTHNGLMYAASSNGIYISLDSGSNWQLGAFGLSATAVSNFRKSPDGILYGLTNDGIIRSINNGDTWAYVVIDSTPVPLSHITGMEVASDGGIYVTRDTESSNSCVLYSSNKGRTWSQQSLLIGRVLDVALDTNGNLYIANYDHGLFASTNRGLSFVLQDNLPTLDPRSVFINTSNDLFVHITEGVFFRKNGSTFFNETNLPTENNHLYSMLFLSNGRMFASTFARGVFLSNDGINWNQINTGLTNYFVPTIVESPSGDIYCGTSTGQIYRLEITNSISDSHVANFSLSQNPASSYTSINHTLDKPSFVTSSLVDIQGKVVKHQMKSWMDAGLHEMQLDVSNLPNGVYTVLLRTNDELMTTKLVVSR